MECVSFLFSLLVVTSLLVFASSLDILVCTRNHLEKICACYKDGHTPRSDHSKEITSCLCVDLLEKSRRSRQQDSIGYVPNCRSDGTFSPKQCSKSGYCWCANRNTGEVIGQKWQPWLQKDSTCA